MNDETYADGASGPTGVQGLGEVLGAATAPTGTNLMQESPA